MSLLIEIDQIRSSLSAPGQPFELVEQVIEGVPLSVYKNLPPNLSYLIVDAAKFGRFARDLTTSRRSGGPVALGMNTGMRITYPPSPSARLL